MFELSEAAVADAALRAANIPIEGVSYTAGDRARAIFAPGATTEQRQQARQILMSLDLSPAGMEAERLKLKKKKAKQAISGESPSDLANRVALRVIYESLIETRAAINTLASNPGAFTPLVNRTWEEALQYVRNRIDQETNGFSF